MCVCVRGMCERTRSYDIYIYIYIYIVLGTGANRRVDNYRIKTRVKVMESFNYQAGQGRRQGRPRDKKFWDNKMSDQQSHEARKNLTPGYIYE